MGGGAGRGRPRAPRGPGGCQRLPPCSAPQGGRARTLVCASKSSSPCRCHLPAGAARYSGLFRTPRRRGGAAGGRDGDRCAPRPMARPVPLPGPPLRAPIGGRAALQVRGGARVPSTAPAASARSPEGCSAESRAPGPGARALAWESVRARVSAAGAGPARRLGRRALRLSFRRRL